MNKVLLATRNRKKLIELQRILDGALGAHRIALIGLDDVEAYPELPETGLTFGENALIKARRGAAVPACRRSRTTPGWRWMPSTGCRGCSAPAGPVGTATTRPTCNWCWTR